MLTAASGVGQTWDTCFHLNPQNPQPNRGTHAVLPKTCKHHSLTCNLETVRMIVFAILSKKGKAQTCRPGHRPLAASAAGQTFCARFCRNPYTPRTNNKTPKQMLKCIKP
jgi:hypothetical protein